VGDSKCYRLSDDVVKNLFIIINAAKITGESAEMIVIMKQQLSNPVEELVYKKAEDKK
jgi:hypothetical protein